jgi:hypothetical protein
MTNERMQAAIRELRDAAAVMDGMEKRLPRLGKFTPYRESAR